MLRPMRNLLRCGSLGFRGSARSFSVTVEDKATEGEIRQGRVKTNCFSIFAKEIGYTVVLPPGYNKEEKLPLLLSLHGGGQSSKELAWFKQGFEARWNSGQMPRCVIAAFSTLNGMGMYHNYHDGSLRYADFFMTEWLPFLQQYFAVSSSRSHTWLLGGSMGGIGSLRLAFTYPEVFAGCAALEPAVDPVFEPSKLLDRNLLMRGDFEMWEDTKYCHGSVAGETKAMFGAVHHTDWDVDCYNRYNPACIVQDNAQNILESDLRIYIDAADQDLFCLQDGAEFLHKTLWQYRIPHEYHLYQNADHLGPSLIPRMDDLINWLCRNMKEVIQPEEQKLTPGQELYLKWLNEQGKVFPVEGEIPPEGAEPVGVFDQAFMGHVRKNLPDFLKKHTYFPTDGVNRLPEAHVRSKRIK